MIGIEPRSKDSGHFYSSSSKSVFFFMTTLDYGSDIPAEGKGMPTAIPNLNQMQLRVGVDNIVMAFLSASSVY